jgi:hypothetical protein
MPVSRGIRQATTAFSNILRLLAFRAAWIQASNLVPFDSGASNVRKCDALESVWKIPVTGNARPDCH